MTRRNIVAVVGGACAGSEITHWLCEAGFGVVVFDQNDLPYGKIEDGLPRWHHKLQEKEKEKIDQKMAHPQVQFIPNHKLGQDITIEELQKTWGIPLVVMANGAWRDRSMRVNGIDGVQDDSFVYQNPFVYWYNHYPDANYSGTVYQVKPDAIVVGGGLASVDVAKICQFEQIKQALESRGLPFEVLDFEHYGVDKALAKHELTYADLAINPTTIFYRRRVADMPLSNIPEDATAEKVEKAKAVRHKLVGNFQSKYNVLVKELHAPTEIHVENGSVKGVTFQKNRIENGRPVPSSETEYVATSQVISSIGSIPEELEGVPMKGELYDAERDITGAIQNMPGVYIVGNAITGKGNIKVSYSNAKRLGQIINDAVQGNGIDYEALFAAQRERAKSHVEKLQEYLDNLPKPTEATLAEIDKKVAALQKSKGYNGDYGSWRAGVLKARH